VAGFIAAQKGEHGIPHAVACRALRVSPSWFYKWCDGDPSPRHARRAQLAVEIRRLFASHHGRYGSPRITADLRDDGWRVSENTVAKIMREQGLAARRRRRRRHTTRQGRGRWRAPDLIGRDFPASKANQKWYGDGTEIETDEGKLFLDSILDMGSRRVVGFALGEHHDAALAEAALAMAVAVRGGRDAIAGVIFHSDQGSEYCANTFRAACGRCRIKQSMGRPGSALDNAVIEAWHSTLQWELRSATSPPRPRPAAQSRPGSSSTTTTGVTPRSACSRRSPTSSAPTTTSRRRPHEKLSCSPGGTIITPSSPGSRPQPSGWPAASLDPGCGRRTMAASPEPEERSTDQDPTN
jgi:putative transposase